MHRLAPVVAILATFVELAGQGSLAAWTAKAERQGFRTGVLVTDLRTGKVRYAHRAKELFIPASNQKILTVAAALSGLGADYRFATAFRLSGKVLEVHAGGDPNWITGSANDPVRIFRKVAVALRQRGVHRLADVRLVHGAFTGPRRPTGWPADQYDRVYCAPSSGLVLDAATFRARIAPGRSSASIQLVAPAATVPIRSGIGMTRAKKKRYSYWLSQRGGVLRGHGKFPVGGKPVTVRGVAQEPEWLFEHTLRTVLAQQGIGVDAPVKQPKAGADIVAREGTAALSNTKDDILYVHRSGLQQALTPILSDSSNFHGEQVLRVLGAERAGHGSFAGGLRALRRELASHVRVAPNIVFADGSGLSRDNRISPELLVAVMRDVCASPRGRPFVASLAQGGVSGTLRRRFGKYREIGRLVRAKTGTINGVKALSGLVRHRDGATLVFSILMNRRKGTSTRGMAALQDEMVAAMHRGR